MERRELTKKKNRRARGGCGESWKRRGQPQRGVFGEQGGGNRTQRLRKTEKGKRESKPERSARESRRKKGKENKKTETRARGEERQKKNQKS